MKNVFRKEAVLQLASVIEHNTCLTKVVLVGLEAEDGFYELGQAMRLNRHSTLTELDLSNNNIKEKGVIGKREVVFMDVGLAEGLMSVRYLIKLRLASCNITSSGIIMIMKALTHNVRVSAYIELLDLSNNPIGMVGSNAIASWMMSKVRTTLTPVSNGTILMIRSREIWDQD